MGGLIWPNQRFKGLVLEHTPNLCENLGWALSSCPSTPHTKLLAWIQLEMRAMSSRVGTALLWLSGEGGVSWRWAPSVQIWSLAWLLLRELLSPGWQAPTKLTLPLLVIRCISHHPWMSLGPHHVMPVQQTLSIVFNPNLAVVVAMIWLWNVHQRQNVKGLTQYPEWYCWEGGWRLKEGMPSRRLLGIIIFVFCFFEARCCSVTMTDTVPAQVGLELGAILLPQLPKC